MTKNTYNFLINSKQFCQDYLNGKLHIQDLPELIHPNYKHLGFDINDVTDEEYDQITSWWLAIDCGYPMIQDSSGTLEEHYIVVQNYIDYLDTLTQNLKYNEVLQQVIKANRIGELSQENLSSLLRYMARTKGNHGIGSGSEQFARELGDIWVGVGATLNGNGQYIISSDNLRQCKLPSYKSNSGYTQANYEWRSSSSDNWINNNVGGGGNHHLDII